MHKIFSFKGITRNTDDFIAGEGECIEVMNMRMKEGSLVPVGRPEVVATLGHAYSAIYCHEVAGCHLCITADGGALHIYDNEWTLLKGEDGAPLFGHLRGVRSVELLGYIVCCLTDAGINYMLFNDGRYVWLGERPPMPSLDISIESKVQRTVTENEYYPSGKEGVESAWFYNSKGFFDEAIYTLNSLGYYIDRALFKFALRLYDGSYISISPAMYVSDENEINGVRRDSGNLLSEAASGNTPSKYSVSVLGFKPKFAFSGIDLDNWKNIVVGIDLFTTGSIMGKKVERVKRAAGSLDDRNNVAEYDVYTDKSIEELGSDISSAAHYYRIAEYDIDGRLIDSLKNVSQVNLVLQASLSNGECSYSSHVPACSYMFNNRLHIGALKSWFIKGYDELFLKNASASKAVAGHVIIKTSLKTLRGLSVVTREYHDVELPYNKGVFELSPLLSYPDTRAFEMCITVNTGTAYVSKSFALTPHRHLEVAQYLHTAMLGFSVRCIPSLSNGNTLAPLRDADVVGMFAGVVGSHKIVYSKSQGTWLFGGVPFPTGEYASLRIVKNERDLEDGDSIMFTITAVDDADRAGDVCNIPVDDSWEVVEGDVDTSEVEPYELRENVLKVSAVENPFVFPAECTYTPTQGRVVALASNTVELSQGQFGQHPLYVFCSDGIWAMSVDTSGSLAYLGCYPLSREVCLNQATVCCIDGGVVFVCSKGVMVISGRSMKNLSACMDSTSDMQGRVLADKVIGKILSMMRLPCGAGNVDFQEYLSGAVIGYLPAHNELLVTNGSFGYSYICSLQNGSWSCVDVVADGVVKGGSQPGLFACKSGACTVMRFGDPRSGDNRVFILTRPQLWGTKLPKRVMQLMLHMYAHPAAERSTGVPTVACYMFGSNDGVHYKLLAGRESEAETQDLKFPYFPSQSHRYYLLAVCGELSSQSRITGLEVEVQPAWNNRLR